MGWRDRDYARLSDDELMRLYGFRRGPAPTRTPAGTVPVTRPTPPARSLSARTVVWTTTAVAVTAVFGFAWTQRQTSPRPPVPAPPAPLYGDALPASSPFGPDTVCTEYEYFLSQGWRCMTAVGNSAHAAVYPAARYSGPCAHLRVLDRSWICLGNDAAPPLPPQAPTAPSVDS